MGVLKRQACMWRWRHCVYTLFICIYRNRNRNTKDRWWYDGMGSLIICTCTCMVVMLFASCLKQSPKTSFNSWANNVLAHSICKWGSFSFVSGFISLICFLTGLFLWKIKGLKLTFNCWPFAFLVNIRYLQQKNKNKNLSIKIKIYQLSHLWVLIFGFNWLNYWVCMNT